MYELSIEVSDYYPSKGLFMVEDLLNFSSDETALDGAEDNRALDALNGASTVSSSTVTAGDGSGSSVSSYWQQFSTDFCQPCEEVAELEWLSNFMEDCFSSRDHPKLPDQFSNTTANSSSSDSTQFASPASNQVPARSARSKRSRANPTNWASRIPILTPLESAPASRDSMEVTSDGCRRCLHCGSEKTPQWRMGPMGPKTLCNACGVRYKSGRLVPEYRPAASPTFVASEHSNSHWKVVELRRQKELMQQQQQMLF